MENVINSNKKSEYKIDHLNQIQFIIKNKNVESNEEIIPNNIDNNIDYGFNDEKNQLKHEEDLVIILKNFYNKVKYADNKYVKNEEDFENFFKNENKRYLKPNLSSFYIIFMIILGGISVIINLISIFILKSVMDTLYSIIVFAIKDFIHKKNYLKKGKSTDFKSLFLSPYNFYERFFDHISNNEIDFDLMMFWDFIGLLLYEGYGFKCSSIICLIFNSLILLLINSFDFLDIDNSTYKYSFVQIFLLLIIYTFLWIGIGSSALLALHIYFNGLKICLKRETIDINIKTKKILDIINKKGGQDNYQIAMNTSVNTYISDITGVSAISAMPSPIIPRIESTDKIFQKEKEDKKGIKLEIFEFPIFTSVIFISFLINYIINRKIYKYKRNYILKILKDNNNDIYTKIYSKEKNIFILCVGIPYCGGIILSVILISIFNSIFINKKNINKNEDDNKIKDSLRIKDNSFKKLCGYLIFKQTTERKKIKRFKEADSKVKCNNCFCKISYLIIKPFHDCFEKMTNSKYKCCNCQCCCNYNEFSFDRKEIDFCLCFQQKGILKWIFDSINKDYQQIIIWFACLNFYCQLFTLGYEEIFDEENKEKNIEKLNIIISLIISYFLYVFFTASFSHPIFKKFHDRITVVENLSSILFIGALVIDFIISIFSFASSIKYLIKPEKSFNKQRDKLSTYIFIVINKFIIFTLSYISTKFDDENELVSNTTYSSVYLYLFDLILYAIKNISTLKELIILQITSSATFFILCILLIIKVKFCN